MLFRSIGDQQASIGQTLQNIPRGSFAAICDAPGGSAGKLSALQGFPEEVIGAFSMFAERGRKLKISFIFHLHHIFADLFADLLRI